jgi:hypothetical protein
MGLKYYIGGPLDGQIFTTQSVDERQKQYRQLNMAHSFGYKTNIRRTYKKIKSIWIHVDILNNIWDKMYGQL